MEEEFEPWDRLGAYSGCADRSRLVCFQRNGLMTVLNGTTGDIIHRTTEEGLGGTQLAMSPDGRAVAWKVNSQVCFRRLMPDGPIVTNDLGKTSIYTVEWHPSGAFFATSTSEGTVDYWDGATGARRESFNWGLSKPWALAFSADGGRGAACNDRGAIVIWDVDV
jgi:WD40 repeat protein